MILVEVKSNNFIDQQGSRDVKQYKNNYASAFLYLYIYTYILFFLTQFYYLLLINANKIILI